MALQQPLTNRHNDEIILYDMTALWDTPTHICDGYVALLQPTRAGSQRKDRENAYILAFMALTEGNVVDACFGVSNYQSRGDDNKGAAFARKAKALIGQAADSSDGVKTLAVDTYRSSLPNDNGDARANQAGLLLVSMLCEWQDSTTGQGKDSEGLSALGRSHSVLDVKQLYNTLHTMALHMLPCHGCRRQPPRVD
jgi:hypothetical protein